MIVNNAVQAMAGVLVMGSLLANNSGMFAEATWLWLTFFAGFMLFQSAFTGFCPAAMLFKAMGLKECCENSKCCKKDD